MSNLQLVKSANFGNVKCDFWQNETSDILMTRKQIGQALEYSNPDDAIYRIHERHKDRLDKFSVVVNLSSTDGKAYDTKLYNSKGIMEICRWSQQPKADAFMDWVWEVIESIRKTGGYSIQRIDSYMISDPIERAKAWIKEQEEKLLLEAKVKELAPAAEFGNAVGNSKASILVRDYVKILAKDGIEIGQDEMFDWLNKKGYIYREKGQWKAYSDYTKMGVLHMIERPFSTAEHGDIIKYTVKITGKGQKYFYEKLKGTEYDKRAS